MFLVSVASVMYTSIGFIDVLGIVSTTTHLRHGGSGCNTKRLLIGISISMCWVGQSGYSRLLAVFVVRSTVRAVRNWGGGTSHRGVIRYAPIIVVVAMMFLFGNQGSSTNSTKLCIFMLLGLILVVFPLPELSFTVAGGVVVRWAGAVTLFPLTCTTENYLQCCRDQKENTAEHGVSQSSAAVKRLLTHWRWLWRTRLFANYKKHDARFQLVSC